VTLLGAADAEAARDSALAFLEPLATRDWQRLAGDLEWTCTETLRHAISTQVYYAAHLATQATRRINVWREAEPGLTVTELLENLHAHNAILAAVIRDAAQDARGYHIFGRADRSGFAAMACDEILVHTYDIGLGLGEVFRPADELLARVVARLFPWAPQGFPAWDTFLWCNGRSPLPGRSRLGPEWVWWCAPVDEWDGTDPTPVG
jgi:hypothetical protein